MLADVDTWHTMKNMALMQNQDNRFLEFLACSKNNINEYLKLITLQDNGTYIGIETNKCTNSFLFIIAKHAKNDTVLTNILTNFEKLKPRDISDLAAFIIIINHIYFKNQLNKIITALKNIIEKTAFVRATKNFCKENESHKILCATI
ncbi:uncharacterized protein LOC115242826 [Formica exsecta]|uniref:uncharacterized protein LOC115242826 n=1 Tax=Formica exsecta TaxID=72781 RepID=UPI001143F89B|nr:uncharacterized protein LOC115242826 [Formica exsecta]